MRKWAVMSVVALALAGSARAGSVTGADWQVHFNLPDQKTGSGSARAEEYVLRDRWLARIGELQSGDWACLSTYTFSGNGETTGAAGPILAAVKGALDRGAKVGFVVGNGVATASNFWPGVSLKGLAARKTNPLKLAQAPSGGIMHHKMGVFCRKGKTPWVLAGSWNFTGGASSQQWNVLTEIQNAKLGAACSNELSQLLAGKFHGSGEKSHDPDGTRFRLTDTKDMKRDGWVRFAPYPEGKYGGDNALTDITNAIAGAKEEIFFGLNKLTRGGVADALIAACDRGVTVHGAVALSDWNKESKDSYEVVRRLLDPAEYTNRVGNRVRIYAAYTTDGKEAEDGGQQDLVHAKYMVIDPWGASPMVIHGSANWTATALVMAPAKGANDEDIEFLPSSAMAQAFAAQFGAMTDGLLPVLEGMERDGKGGWTLRYWHPPGTFSLERNGTGLGDAAGWKATGTKVPDVRRGTVSGAGGGRSGFFRLRGE